MLLLQLTEHVTNFRRNVVADLSVLEVDNES